MGIRVGGFDGSAPRCAASLHSLPPLNQLIELLHTSLIKKHKVVVVLAKLKCGIYLQQADIKNANVSQTLVSIRTADVTVVLIHWKAQNCDRL